MSLVRLLTTGKSLVGLRDSESRYRMRSKHLLPRFGSKGNPFSPPASEPVQAEAPAPKKIARYQMSAAELAAARMKETRRLPEGAPAQTVAAAPDKPPRLAAVRVAVSAAMRKLNPVGWFSRRRVASKPAASELRGPVQCELSLDSVKVVRNDLSDADVVVVAARTASRPKPEGPEEPVIKSETPELAIQR